MLPSFVEPTGPGLYTIDTGYVRPRFDASYLLVDRGRAAFIDTGTHHALPRLLQALQAVGLKPEAVDWVIPTHVHLDHAGGCGSLIERLPRAQVLVHPRGARHLIDPTALWEGAARVYGDDEMVRAYGKVVPVAEARVMTSADGMTLSVGSRRLQIADTPGHARHHHCIWDEASQGWFTGDTFGLSYPELHSARGACMLPTTTPVQFDPEPLMASVRRMLQRSPQRMYVTHYGAVDGLERAGPALLERIEAFADIARRAPPPPLRDSWLRTQMRDTLLHIVQQHGSAKSAAEVAELLAMDIELNAQGLAVWLDTPRGR